MKRCSRILSFILVLTLLISIIPSCLGNTVFAADAEPKYVVTSNIGFATDKTDATKPYLSAGTKWIASGTVTVIDYNNTQGLQIENYTSIAKSVTLDYIEIDGRKIYYSEFEKYTTASQIDTKACPNLNGRTVKIRLNKGNPQIQFDKKTGNPITQDISIKIVFKTQDAGAAYNLQVVPGEHGKVYETKWLANQEDGSSLYALYVRPEYDYQLKSYTTADDNKEHELAISERDYALWTNPNSKGNYDRQLRCEYFELSIFKDTIITLNYKAATIELELWSYMPQTNAVPFWGFGAINPYDTGIAGWKLNLEENSSSVPLVEDGGAKFYFKININGFLTVSDPRVDYESFQLYKGAEVAEENLLLDSNDSSVIKNATAFTYGQDFDVSGQVNTYFIHGGYPGAGCVGIVSCPELEQITAVVRLAGRTLKTTVNVQMTSDVDEVKQFVKYYQDTYGLDKMGQEAYTEEEKQTKEYELYCQYSTFRYELRKVYREQAQLIAAAAPDERTAALETAKAALDAAAIGADCNAVSWSFNNNEEAGTHWKPTLTAIPNDGDNIKKTGTSASDAMCAALEAEYPGNWSYNGTSTQFGMFVNEITVGGENDTGKMNVRASSSGPGTSYGFWYYNGKFSEWGVSNYYPYDGDVMAWGNPDVAQSWALAILRFHYKNNGGDDALEKDMAARGVSYESSGEELENAFPEYNFKRYGQFREVSPAELVIQQINAIGTVSPDSGDAIDAALKAYDALSEEEKEKVYNYQALLDAKAAFDKLKESSGVEYSNALAAVLTKLNGTTNVGIGSTNGAWLTLALARGGIITGKDTEGVATKYLGNLASALRNGSTNLSQQTDYARVTLAMTALGVEAPESVLSVLRDYDAVTTQGINAVAYALIALDSKPYDESNTALRTKYVNFLLNNACYKGGWVYGDDRSATADVDMTAMVIQALAPYYLKNDNDTVRNAVEKALDVLQGMQKSTGGFSSYGTYNAESTAQVIVALTALGIDPTSDGWSKAYGNPIEALLHFYNADTSKFRHASNGLDDQMATEQSAYALVAYNRFVNEKNRLYDMRDAFGESGEVSDDAQLVASAKLEIEAFGTQIISMKVANTKDEVQTYIETLLKQVSVKGPTYTVARVYDFRAAVEGTEEKPGTGGKFTVDVLIELNGTTATARIDGKITATQYVEPKEDITVTFTLLGDSHHTITDDSEIHSYRFNADEMPKWVKETTFKVEGGSTVGDVFQQILDKNGIKYTGLSSGYIDSITYDGTTLVAKDDGRDNSGWMYLVKPKDGEAKHPDVGLNSYELSDGDTIIWHWTDDYKIEEGSEHWSASRVVEYVANLYDLAENEQNAERKAQLEKQADEAFAVLDSTPDLLKLKSQVTTLRANRKSVRDVTALIDAITDWNVPMKTANDRSTVTKWVQDKLNKELEGKLDGVTLDIYIGIYRIKPATDEANGKYTVEITVSKGSGSLGATSKLNKVGVIKAPSADAGVSSIIVCGAPASVSEDGTYTVTVPYNSTVTAGSFTITLSSDAASVTAGPAETEESGVWTFTVTAENGTTTADYTVKVLVAADPAEGNKAAVDAAKAMLEKASFIYASKDVNTEAAAKAAVERQIGALFGDADIFYEITMTGFTAAEDGTLWSEPTNGSFSFTVKLTKGENDSYAETTASLTGTITAASKPVTPPTPSKPTKPSTKPTDEPAKPDASKFVDISKNNWYFDAVQYVLENGLMNGTSASEFSPNANTTRSMIVTILARMEGVNTSGGATWYARGREWAMENGISDGANMEGKITREQLAAMLYRYAKMKGYDVSASASLSGYTDASSVSSWAKDAMQWAVGSGLIQGSNNALTPQANASRAQIATILMRFAQNIAK